MVLKGEEVRKVVSVRVEPSKKALLIERFGSPTKSEMKRFTFWTTI